MSTPEATAERSVESPYVGLTHYTEEYADRFFGRDAQIAVIIGNLRAARLTLLYAESGVGKSSLLRAGVAARLRALADSDAEARGSPRWFPVVFSSWTDQPLAALIDTIDEAIRPYLGEREVELPRDSLAAAVEAASEATDATVLVILDQFEEYSLYRPKGERKGGLADQVAECVNSQGLRANFLISIREDAYATLGDLFRGRLTNVYGNFLHLDYLGRDEARAAITKPIERVNELDREAELYMIEPALVEAVLDQVRRGAGGENGDDPTRVKAGESATDQIETTFLQLVMKRLWDEEAEEGSRCLRLETLDRLGGAHRIIGTHLDRSMSALAPEQQAAAAALFRFLVTKAGTKIALTARDLSELSEVPVSDADPVLRRLAAGDVHILRPIAPRDGRDAVSYEIFHDALARPIVEWRTRKDKAELAARVERERAAKEAAQQETAEAEQREERERGRKRIAIIGVVVLGIGVAVLGSVLAIVQGNRADEREKTLDSVQAAQRIFELSGSPTFGQDAAALASLEAYRLWPTREARNRTLETLALNTGLPRTATGHTRSVNAVSFWPGSSRFASGGADGTVRLWDADGGRLGSWLAPATVLDVAVSPAFADGSRVLAAALNDGQIAILDVTDPETPRRLEVLEGSTRGAERAVAFNPAEPGMLAAAGDDGAIQLWDVRGANGPRRLDSRQSGGEVYDLAFAANGKAVFTAGDAGKLEWTINDSAFADGEPVSRGETDLPTDAVAVAPNGSYAFAVWDGTERAGIELHDANRDRDLFLPTTDYVNGLAFADRGATLLSAGGDWAITTWDVESARPFGVPRSHGWRWAIWDLAVSDDGATLASAGDDKTVKLWPLEPEGSLATTVGGLTASEVSGDVPEISALAIGASDQVAGAADQAGVFVWSLDRSSNPDGPAEPVSVVPGSSDDPSNAVAYHGDTLAASQGSSFRLWDTGESCEQMPERPCLVGRPDASPHGIWYISALAFGSGADDADILASGDYDGDLSLWAADPTDGEVEHLWSAPRKVHKGINGDGLAFSPTDPLLAVAGVDGTVRFWDVSNPREPVPVGKPLVEHERQEVTEVEFSPDGDLLVSGGLDQQVVFWDVSWDEDGPSVEPSAETVYQTNSILGLAFSRPDGETLATGDGDGSLCFFDVDSRRYLGGCPQGHDGFDVGDGAIDAVAFAPDGSAALTAGRGNPIVSWDQILWNTDDGDETVDALTAHVCELAGRNLTQDEWDQAFADTELEGERHQTCEQHP